MAGATIGVLLGVGYAWLMVYGLRTWWLAAISTPFLRLHVSWFSAVVGWLAGLVVSWLTIRWSIRRLVRLPVTRLMSGARPGEIQQRGVRSTRTRLWPVARLILIALIIGQAVAGFFIRGEAQAGVFFGGGAATLVLLLGEVRYRLRQAAVARPTAGLLSLGKLSTLNTARNPGRSTLTIGLVAAASFLIIAVSAFHLNTGEGGTGGFQYIGTSDLPVHYDLNTAEGRRELGFADAANKQLENWQVFALRVADGENASCLNLYQPQQPRVLGVPRSLVDRGGFAWSATEADFAEYPWRALDAKLGADGEGHEVIPVVLDMSTAVYSLHLKGVGSQLKIRDSADREVTLQIVGMLENSVLQGNALVSEENFLKLFPDVAGYRFFLIEPRERVPTTVQEIVKGNSNELDGMRSMPATLESTLAEEGFDVQDAKEQLAQFLAVQNTYLSTFQSLGGLGLLLGTVGLAVVQLRSVLERRGELALMRAGGFHSARLMRMVILENAVLLLGGLAVGGIAAMVALVPQWLPHAASAPWATLAVLMGTIAVIGLVAGWLATRSVLRAPIVAALRGD
jgi:hypothetical protein